MNESKHPRRRMSRRTFLAGSASAAGAVALAPLESALAADAAAGQPRQAGGIKVGEVTDTSAIVWMRATAAGVRNNDGIPTKGDAKPKNAKRSKGEKADEHPPTEKMEGACPGAAGRVRVRFSTREDLSDATATEWTDVTEASDFHGQVPLTGLKPSTVYHYSAETTGPGGSPVHGAVRGRFETAPAPDQPTNILFCVQTCQAYKHCDHPDGFHIYQSMLNLKPQFVAYTGDNVYYDSEEPQAVNEAFARHHWQRMYSMPRHIELTRNVAGYWEKDDHDTVNNDCWPGMTLGDLTFVQGQKIFLQQVPAPKVPYRTFRWGKDLQVWLSEGRDFRSNNNMKDGPNKTIWGEEQKAWFKKTVKESDATWKVLISPDPLVGPDRGTKNDNHANTGFTYEGDELRGWIQQNVPNNFFVVNGDRHWQYHSVHPKFGVKEFSVGPASDIHASGSPGEDKTYHKFHRVKGGFLSVAVKHDGAKSGILFELRDVMGKVVYSWKTASA